MSAARTTADCGLVSIDGQQLEFRELPPIDKTTVTFVLLHEGLGCVATWRDFPQQLNNATGARVFAYSRSGYGKSSGCALPRPLDYMQHEGEKVLPLILDAIGAKRCVLLGHSDGASIAAIHAGAHNDPRIAGLVLMAPHFFTEAAGLQAIAQAKQTYEQLDLRERLLKYHGENVDCAFRGWNDAWLHPDFRDWNITAYLANIKVPILAMQGVQDPYGSAAQLHALQEYCVAPVERLLFDDCAHTPFREQPQQTLDAICNWMATTVDTENFH